MYVVEGTYMFEEVYNTQCNLTSYLINLPHVEDSGIDSNERVGRRVRIIDGDISIHRLLL